MLFLFALLPALAFANPSRCDLNTSLGMMSAEFRAGFDHLGFPMLNSQLTHLGQEIPALRLRCKLLDMEEGRFLCLHRSGDLQVELVPANFDQDRKPTTVRYLLTKGWNGPEPISESGVCE